MRTKGFGDDGVTSRGWVIALMIGVNRQARPVEFRRAELTIRRRSPWVLWLWLHSLEIMVDTRDMLDASCIVYGICRLFTLCESIYQAGVCVSR